MVSNVLIPCCFCLAAGIEKWRKQVKKCGLGLVKGRIFVLLSSLCYKTNRVSGLQAAGSEKR